LNPGRPDSPYAVRIVNSTHNSLTLAWNPGFNGGLPQKFQIRYRKVGTDETKHADVLPHGATTYTLTGEQWQSQSNAGAVIPSQVRYENQSQYHWICDTITGEK